LCADARDMLIRFFTWLWKNRLYAINPYSGKAEPVVVLQVFSWNKALVKTACGQRILIEFEWSE